MTHLDAASYFAQRAPRYRLALTACPYSRMLDLLPYVAILESSTYKSEVYRICDAFGGTGFIARGLLGSHLQFVVCDCCEEMLSGAKELHGVQTCVTNDDFASVLKDFGGNSFDVVLSHGGLHHVVDSKGGIVNEEESRKRQMRLIERLGNLLRPGGTLIIADIPDQPTEEISPWRLDIRLSRPRLESYLPSPGLTYIENHLGISFDDPWSLGSLRAYIHQKLWKRVSFPVPREFFDKFIARESPLGHIAIYPDFNALHTQLISNGMAPLGRINYQGPWLFRSMSEAGWFFREKFSFFNSSLPGQDVDSEQHIAKKLDQYLGYMKGTCSEVSVNWGVTYAAYQRRELNA